MEEQIKEVSLEVETKKPKKTKGMLVLIILIICGAGGIFFFQTDHVLVALEDIPAVEYGEEFSTNIEDYLNLSGLSKEQETAIINNAKVIVPEEQVVGEATITITYDSDEIDIAVQVVDTIAPVFEDIHEEFIISLVTGEALDEETISNFKATDLSEVTITFDDSEVDYTTAGKYSFTIIATDESGNKTELVVSITVEEATLEADESKITLTVDDTKRLDPIYNGTLKDDETFTYESGNEAIATVNESGKITALKQGSTTITISYKELKTEVKLTVIEEIAYDSSSSSGSNVIVGPGTNYMEYMDKPEISMEAFNLINTCRKNAGYSELPYSNEMAVIAYARAKELQDSFSHAAFASYYKNYNDTHDNGTTVTEVITMRNTTFSCMSATDAVANWMNSQEHYDILMSEENVSFAVAYMNNRWVAVISYNEES